MIKTFTSDMSKSSSLRLCTVALLLFVCLFKAQAQSTTVNGVSYSALDNRKLTAQVDWHWSFYGDLVIEPTVVMNGKTYTVTHICDYAFSICGDDITSITLPETITYIGTNAFNHCSRITSLVIPNSVTYIGESAFVGAYNLKSLTIGESVETIEPTAFFNCSSLTEVTIPNATTYIGRQAFSNCNNLTTLNIGTEMYSNELTICEGAFETSTLSTIYSHNLIPPTVANEGVFHSPTYEGTLYVYDEVYADYEEAFVWEKFFNKASTITAVDSVISDDQDAPVEYYTLSGRKLADKPSTPGVYIVKQGKSSKKVAIR